jgi:hypothetical protein
MTFAQLTVIAEAAKAKASESIWEGAERSYDGVSYLRDEDVEELSQVVYDAVIEEGRQFVKPLYPIYEIE